MLASITPLGERSRRQRWWLTVAGLIAGGTVASAAVGAGLAAVGGIFGWGAKLRLDVLLVIVAMAVIVEAGPFGLRVPSHRRQVDDAWLRRYRGWVYGVGFGFQLGVGVWTTVTTAAVYAMLAGEVLAPSVAAGAAIGAVFGLVRGGTSLATAPLDSPERLAAFHRGFHRAEPAASWVATAAQAVAVIGVAITL